MKLYEIAQQMKDKKQAEKEAEQRIENAKLKKADEDYQREFESVFADFLEMIREAGIIYACERNPNPFEKNRVVFVKDLKSLEFDFQHESCYRFYENQSYGTWASFGIVELLADAFPLNECQEVVSEKPYWKSRDWIGVDLDRTLAFYDGWLDAVTIGQPIKPMLNRVFKWIEQGQRVKIFTARVAVAENDANQEFTRAEIVEAIENWCERFIGQKLEITNEKDFDMTCLYDDRAIQVEANTGRIIESLEV